MNPFDFRSDPSDVLNPFGLISGIIGSFANGSTPWDDWKNSLNPGNNDATTADALTHEELRQDSQYQRMVEDLRKAGLNPWLALQNGFGSAGSYATNPNQDEGTDIKSLIATILMIMRIGALAGA